MQYDIIPGRSSENAKRALELAEERGFDTSSVLTYFGGYKVPASPESEDGDIVETIPGTEGDEPHELKTEAVDPDANSEEKADGEDDQDKGDPAPPTEAEAPQPATKTARKRTAKKE